MGQEETWENLTDNDFLDKIQNETESEESQGEFEEILPTHVTHKEAAKCQTCFKWAEQNSETAIDRLIEN